jgi:Asp-tRNA(Asn)/Glu-tRNA(Gln) amidotransferase A subunit family amidase
MAKIAEFEEFDAIALGEIVRKGYLPASDVLDEVIARIEAVNPKLNAIVYKMYDQARETIARGLPAGPLSGVPYMLKDLGALYTGSPTTSGSRFFADYVADHDSTMTARLRGAGLVICAKTASPEFGQTTTTESALFGQTRNPWHREFSAGGSSGGAAAAVAARILPAAHATDGGGSIRIPASCCGLFGLKPTRARTPHGPDFGEGWSGASIAHAVTRSVRDSAALLDAVHGPEAGDPYCAPYFLGKYLVEAGKAPRKLKIALTTTSFNGSEVDRECAAAANDAARLCESLGHQLEEARPEINGPELAEAQRMIVICNIRVAVDSRAQQLGRAYTTDDLEPMTLASVKAADKVTGADYARSIQSIHRAGRVVGRFFEKYDVLLTPTMATTVLPLGLASLKHLADEHFRIPLLRTIGFTALFNAAGNPAMSVPLAWSKSGLPIGIQFAGRFGDEATLFRLASQLEQARPWADRKPTL